MNKEQKLLNIIQQFEDLIAQKTKWTPLNKRIANFVTHQLLRSSTRWVASYEINLVLKDGNRHNIIGHNDLKVIKEDTKKLSYFLQIPI